MTLCNKCLTDGGIAGQGFTPYTCKGCGKTFWHHNTAVPMYCEECSKKLNVCEKCGEPLKKEG